MTNSSAPRTSRRARTITGIGALVVLVIAMLADTKYLSPDEAAAVNPAKFDAASFVKEEFAKIADGITAKATDITVLAPAIEDDVAAAGKKYGTDLGSGKFAFPATATGTVEDVDANFIVLKVAKMPSGDTVRIPVGAALSGTPVRDATGELTFGDFPSQTDYQEVANQLKLTMQSKVLKPADPASLDGKQVTVVGGYASGGPPNSFIIQPVSLEVGK
jgi:predicted lipoprotein